MAEAAAPTDSGVVPPDPDRLARAVREARDDAAPFALVAAVVLVLLALVSRHAHWDLLGHSLWWIWLVVAVPYVLPLGDAALRPGPPRPARSQAGDRDRAARSRLGLQRRRASSCSSSRWWLIRALQMTGRQLLFSGGAVWFTDVVAFGLAFWELDCGGPVARALAAERREPDFQFPQDENPSLARDGWAPRLWDYFYISLTNSIAFSPTDTMPLTRAAKALMAAESMLSAVTVLLVAARAVNILA